MRPISSASFIIKRLSDDWKLLLSAFVGILIATCLVAGAPVYLQALERQSVNTDVDRAADVFLNVFILGPNLPLNKDSLRQTDATVDGAIREHISDLERSRRRYVKTSTHLVGLPHRPLPTSGTAQVSRGYFQHMSNLEENVTFIEGSMAADTVTDGPQGPIFEAVLGTTVVADMSLKVGDILTMAPSIGESTRVSVRLAGIIEAKDPDAEYWQRSAEIYISPSSLQEEADPDVVVDPDEPPLALFVTENALTEGVGKAFPGTLVSSSWFVLVDKESLKDWSVSETRARMDGLENDLIAAMRGATVFTGIDSLLDDFERRSFFSTVPLLLLLTIMVITVLYYLGMMVSYLVQSRESDVAVLRSRGISTWQLLRLYALEGLVLTVVAVVLAPFLAMGAVALAGTLPYLHEITGGDMLPVEFHWMPFLVAAGTGAVSLAIFVIPGVTGARTSLVIHKLRSSRPPTIPLFQRYYLDIGLLVLGGIVFWELQAKGELVSGGLFEDFEVNEALLLAPVLFLTVVALLFLRFFPLFVRFIGGESPGLVHLLTAATVVTLGPAIIGREVSDDNGLASVAPVILLTMFTGAYWATHRARQPVSRLAGLALQSGLIAGIVLLEPPVSDEVSFVPTLSLISIVPAQLVFWLFQSSARIAPVWVSMGLWHMARNPLQYSWLVLLLVMVTGLGLLAARVGGTLKLSHEERIRYDVAADLRVSNIPEFMTRGRTDLKERFLTIPGVQSVSLTHRSMGSLGTSSIGRQFQVLAVESQDFPYISWYRDDFSERPLTDVMRALQFRSLSAHLTIPEDATSIGVWVKPEKFYPNVSLRLIVEDARGSISALFLGPLGDPDWTLMSTEMPRIGVPPLKLVSVQISEPGFGPSATPGSILLDDIHVTKDADPEVEVLDDFEGPVRWSVLPTSIISSDSISNSITEVLNGNGAGLFSFGKDTDRGIRGFIRDDGATLVPVAASSSFLKATGTDVGNAMIIGVMGHFVPIVIRDSVDYFPTLNPGNFGFVLADLDTLLRQINILGPALPVSPNELLIDEAPGAGQAVREVALSIAGSPTSVRDKEAQLTAVRLDPLITGGWKAMVLLSLVLIIVIAGMGYLTYLLAFADRSRSEMGFLRSMGLSWGQMAGLLALEHLVVVLVGLGLGSWAGLEMSRRMVSSVAVTDRGSPVLPPFILITDWSFMGPIYAALVALFLIALFRLNRGMRNLDMHTISRLEGN